MSARDRAALLPLAPGVYRFRDAAGHVLYLGRATRLRRRVTSYWGDLGGRPHLSRMVPRIARVEAVVCASAHEAAWLERNLLTSGVPRWNRAPTGGQEVEVWIRLSDAARSRAGRLTGWTQRSCAEKTAQAHVGVTAPGWQQFAQRNAHLAARLSAGNGGRT